MKITRRKGSRRFNSSSQFKSKVVYSFFWGRSNLYKQTLHLFIAIVSIVVLATGFSARFLSQASTRSLDTVSIASGDVDLLEQGGSVQTILVSNNTVNFKVAEYLVKEGDSLDSIVESFGVSKDTIKWANKDKIDFYDETVKPGDTLLIPEINGVLYEVKEGDNLDSVLSSVQNSDRFLTIEINNLKAKNYVLAAGDRLLIPDGTLPPPPKEEVIYIPQFTQRDINYTPVILDPGVVVAALGNLVFIDPLSHPDCAGYGYSRGYADWHQGVDLGRGGGCPIRSIEAGTVIYAGWGSGGQGYYVAVDHGNGVISQYFHGDGNIWVRTGDFVSKGQDLMYMGCTGFCTGTHLHLVLQVSGIIIDPAPYVPYYRP